MTNLFTLAQGALDKIVFEKEATIWSSGPKRAVVCRVGEWALLEVRRLHPTNPGRERWNFRSSTLTIGMAGGPTTCTQDRYERWVKDVQDELAAWERNWNIAPKKAAVVVEEEKPVGGPGSMSLSEWLVANNATTKDDPRRQTLFDEWKAARATVNESIVNAPRKIRPYSSAEGDGIIGSLEGEAKVKAISKRMDEWQEVGAAHRAKVQSPKEEALESYEVDTWTFGAVMHV